MERKQNEHLLHYWTRNLVESPIIFTFNLAIISVFGIIYSFRVNLSPFILLVFGILTPVILTICLYHMVGNSLPEIIPATFSKKRNRVIFALLDCSLITILGILIFSDILNFFFFRFLQTFIVPIISLFMLRVLYLSEKS
ncbi:MAG: hypothetical protein PWR03_1012 [Tenuifilum sp.]|jgi:hypothetical protein|uniref:hypothetical protein n=1 Tax=Tenuifilum sp. TaxID=2760880 RepID=UPI0024AB0395|nr:hypothetical protein [Tenuifilum sp.]MDI3526829.1 hypothetical protein [Tenuifilum sp.]